MDPDAGLIRRMNQGDDEAIEAFVRKYYPQILGYCCYHLRHRQDGEDVTQETFARFFASLDRYRHYGKAANYLYVIAGNLCRDHL
ncbi:RNA polymerase sigma factor, partial [Evtepia sp.]